MKKCSRCKLIQEIINFGKDIRRKDSLNIICKTCSKILGKKHRENVKKNKNYTFPETKKCSKCKIIKNANEFYKCTDKKIGLRASCILCVKQENNTEVHKKKVRKRSKNNNKNLKSEIIKAYGSYCTCCTEFRYEFLTIDHINNNGNIERKETGRIGMKLYYFLRNNNYPKNNYQLLCMNCNFAKGKYGSCPHQKERESLAQFAA